MSTTPEAITAQTSHRLDRIESKIDKLAETVISLARAEEKLLNIEHEIKTLLERMKFAEKRQNEQDKELAETKSTMFVINRVFWIVLSFGVVSALGAIATKIIQQ